MNDLFDLHGKKAIVTGASKGLGWGMAEALLEQGCETVLIGSSEGVLNAANTFCARGLAAHAVRADLRSRAENQRAFEESLGQLGGELDILCTAAGIQRRHSAEEFPLDEWDEVLSINLHSVWLLNQLAGREMLKKGYGKIINVASMASFFGGQTVPAYAASKGAVAQLTKALSNDWAARGINVNAIAPGYMATELNTALLADETRLASINQRIPSGRWGTPEDMKGCTIFLASKASDYVCGAVIPVDGGYLVK